MTFRQVFQKFVDTKLYSRLELSEVFHVSTEEIDSWFEGTALPDPSNMRSLHHVMQEDLRFPTAEWNEVMSAPVKEALSDCKLEIKDWPNEMLQRTNLMSYSLEPMRQGFMRMFRCLTCDEQEELMGVFSKMIRERILK